MGTEKACEWDPVEVAARAKEYDPEAFGALFDRYFEKIRRYAYFQTGDLDAADELASEVFKQALESIASFDDRGGSIGAWLYGIARNIIAAHFRAAGKMGTVITDSAAFIAVGGEPEKRVLEKSTYEDLYTAITRLPAEQREIIILRFIEGYRVTTVARILDKRPGAVRAQQHRAIASLRKMFESGEFDATGWEVAFSE